MFEPEDMLGLALEEDASARLLSQASVKQADQPQWHVKKKPTPTKTDFENLPEHWTALVQNLEQWSPELGQLWKHLTLSLSGSAMTSYWFLMPQKVAQSANTMMITMCFWHKGYGSRRWQLGKVL